MNDMLFVMLSEFIKQTLKRTLSVSKQIHTENLRISISLHRMAGYVAKQRTVLFLFKASRLLQKDRIPLSMSRLSLVISYL